MIKKCKILNKLPEGSKLIPGTDVYFVNPEGIVTKLTKEGYKEVYLITHYTGWLTFYIYEKNKRRLEFLHKLLGKMFIPNPDNYKYLRMKDGNKRNVKVDNLEWCTYHDTVESTRKYKYTNPNPKAKLRLTNDEIIALIKEIIITPNEKYAWSNLAKKYNITVQLLAKIRTKSCYKEYWKKYGSVDYEYKSIYSSRFNKNTALMLIRDIASYDVISKNDLDYICNKYKISQFRLWNIRKQKVYKDIWKRDEFKNYKYQTVYGKDGK